MPFWGSPYNKDHCVLVSGLGSRIEVNHHIGVSTSAIFELSHTASPQCPGATLDQDFWEDPILLLGSFP